MGEGGHPERRQILIEGVSPEQLLSLPDEDIAALLSGGPIVFRAGSASILGEIRLLPGRLTIELAQIDGGGEGVLPMLWSLAGRYAQRRGLDEVEWIVHAVTCARPNLKLRRLLERRGFEVRAIEGVGSAYHFRHKVKRPPRPESAP